MHKCHLAVDCMRVRELKLALREARAELANANKERVTADGEPGVTVGFGTGEAVGTEVGIAVAETSDGSRVYAAQVFATPGPGRCL